MKSPILITAFDSFGGRNYNPTERLLGTLPEDGIKKLTLPTSYSRAPELLRAAVKDFSPAAVVCTGLASGRSAISLEFAALNIKDADVPDNDGERASGENVVPGAPNALFTDLDLAPYARIIREGGPIGLIIPEGWTDVYPADAPFLETCWIDESEGGCRHIPTGRDWLHEVN